MKIREITLCSLFIALITAGAFIRIPVGTDVYTLQFLFTLLAGLVLGARLGAITVTSYVFMGLIGIPVLASGGGPAYILQPTFGYLVGFIIQAWFCGFWSRRLENVSVRSLLAVNLGGMAIVYILGIGYFYLASNYIINAPISFWAAIFYCGILQAPADFLLSLSAAVLGVRFHRAGIWTDTEQINSNHVEA